jgi:peptidoglycan/xylan/chitin deacetylase (PgdA/CDA1 family)
MLTQKIYYRLKPGIPRWLQIQLRRWVVLNKREKYSNVWPIDEKSANPPNGWSGWPDGKQFALVLTHDVETLAGQQKCFQLAKLEESLGFRSSFNFVPEEYNVSHTLRNYLTEHGFEVGAHGLYHDGNLFSSKKKFQKQAFEINRYLKEWKSVGFRTPCMYHNLEWISGLNIEYDSSTFDTDPFEPQPDGVGTIFPFWVQNGSKNKGFVELPYTLPQDFTLFVLMREKKIDIWKRKLDWIAGKGGMALLNTHPDYMDFGGKKPGMEEYPVEYYEEFLQYIKSRYGSQIWHALPKDISRFWRDNIVNDRKFHQKR